MQADEVVINQTTSGHATWNDFSFVPIGKINPLSSMGKSTHLVLARSVPFGGVGESGWGSYHGWEGFKTFSHEKGELTPRLWQQRDQLTGLAILELPF